MTENTKKVYYNIEQVPRLTHAYAWYSPDHSSGGVQGVLLSELVDGQILIRTENRNCSDHTLNLYFIQCLTQQPDFNSSFGLEALGPYPGHSVVAVAFSRYCWKSQIKLHRVPDFVFLGLRRLCTI